MDFNESGTISALRRVFGPIGGFDLTCNIIGLWTCVDISLRLAGGFPPCVNTRVGLVVKSWLVEFAGECFVGLLGVRVGGLAGASPAEWWATASDCHVLIVRLESRRNVFLQSPR